MNIKRSLPLILVLLMVFSSFAQAASFSRVQESKANQIAGIQNKLSKYFNNKELEKNYKKTDKVRVIVEVDGDPAITYATKAGKKYSELSQSTKTKLQTQILEAQKDVKSQFAKQSINMQYKQHFTTAFNGFSGIVEYGEIPAIESLDGVTNVTISHEYQRPEEKPDMKYSKEIVEAQKAWEDYGYKGEGMVVGIIDTGIDPSHKDMVLTDGTKAALTKAGVDTLVSEKGLPGKFYTEKVPYGYNYADQNNEILDLGPDASMHGMHVSGIVGANGDENNGGIKGVAPEAQLLALKVFGNDPQMPSTWSDIYVKAIDDAIILGADVLNMSLGSSSAFVSPEDPEQQAIEKAVNNGVLMSISAGNSGDISYGSGKTPFASNPDIGVVGSPGLSHDSIQVASLENNFLDLDAITYSFNTIEAGKSPFLSASSVNPNQQSQKQFEILDAGIGQSSDFVGKDFTGKYALIKRGSISFVAKTLNAQNAGAAGVIIYNNADGFVSMATDPAITIPQLFMLKADGDKLKAELNNGTNVSIEFKGDKVTTSNPLKGHMADSTSWGVTPNLDFKPEITAPGGNIYSTLNNNQYGVMSGTSMAAPHVSGGSAIVLERVKNDFKDLKGAARVNMAKNILMNTAKTVEDKGYYNGLLGTHNPYSPRRQGAGVMQLHSALSTPIVVTNAATNEAKVALKEINGDMATFTLKAENVSDKDVTYKVSGNVQTDLVIKGVSKLESQGIYKASGSFDPNTGVGEYPISFSKNEITIPAHQSANVDVTVDLNDTVDWYYNAPLDDIFKNGYFVEGFVTLTDVSDTNPVISVPYVGFKGDWNKAPVLDEMIYDGKEADSFYKQAGMVTEAGEDKDGVMQYGYLGYNPVDDSLKSSKIAISPNGDGINDNVIPELSFLRNAKLVEYKVLDRDGKALRKIKSDLLVRKNYADGGRGSIVKINPANAWDGKVKNKLVADGQYYYEIASTIDYPGKAPQSVKVPVIVDTVAPVVTAHVNGDTLTIDSTNETGSGVAFYDVLVNGKSVFGENDKPLAGNATGYKFTEAPVVGSTVEVVAYDFAGNSGEAVVEGVNDHTIPFVHVTSLDALTAFNQHELPVTGYITDESQIRSFTVNGKDVELVWNAEKSRYEFNTTITLEDGVQKIEISGKDVAGNEISFLREIMVDTTAPEIKVDVPAKVKTGVESVELTATISDNFDELRYFVDGSEEFYKEFAEPFAMRSYSKEVKTQLQLEPGNNTFTLELVDIAGNKTTKEVTIFRGESKYVVNYLDGTTVLKTDEVVEDAKTTPPPNLSKTGYTFIGWYTDATFKTKFDFNTPIAAETNVYAQFVQNPEAPASVNVANTGYDKLNISWEEVSGASGYDVYRSTSEAGPFSKVASITSGSTVSFTDSGLTTDQTYYYKVKAYKTVDGTNVYGSDSSTVNQKPALNAPTALKVTKVSSTSVKLSWNKVSEASGYEIYSSTKKSEGYTKVKTISPGTNVSYTATGLKNGSTYYYKIRSYRVVNGKNVYSSYSSVVSYVNKSVIAAPKAPAALKASKASSTSIKVSWNKVSDASGYEIYRSTTKSGKYTKVKSVTSAKTVSYTNTGLQKGKTYYYKVRSYHVVNGKNVYSSYSSVVSFGLAK